MAVAELKQASSQPNGQLPSKLLKRQSAHQPYRKPSSQLSSELPAARSDELLSQLPSESLTITSDADSTLIQTTGSEEALAATSELPGGSLDTTPQLDVTLTQTTGSEEALAATSELPGGSLEPTPQLDVTLTQTTGSEEALAVTSKLPGESLETMPQLDVTLTQATVSEEALAPNHKEVVAQNHSRLTGAALARRLGVAPGSISRNKQKENFAAWTSIHDPDGLAWEFDGQTFHRVSSSPAD